MRNLSYLMMFLSGSIFAQSIQLNHEPSSRAKTRDPGTPHPAYAEASAGKQGLSYVEFRDAELSNIWMLIDTQSGLNGLKLSPENLPKTELSLRLENVSWAQLLKIIRNQATP